MKTDFFFTIKATENEHYIVEDMIRKECLIRGYNVLYYRKFKAAHIPLYRECKIDCSILDGEKLLKDLDIDYGNYYKSRKENLEKLESDLRSGKLPAECREEFYKRERLY